MATAILSPERLVDERQAAEILGLKNHKTLSVWRCIRKYPTLKFLKVGASVRYRISDIEKFLSSRTVGVDAE